MAHSCMAIQSPTPRCPSPSTAVSSYSTAPDCSSVFSPIKPLVSRRTPRLRHHEYNGTCYAVKDVHSERSGAPGTAARRGFSSPRDNMVAPSSNFRVEAKAPVPSPMVTEGFGSVITQLFQYRIIRCGGAVDEDMANLIVGQLLYLDSVDPNKDIVMYINCPGGSVTAGMAIFDAMKHIRPNVSTVCVGLAASMGSFLLSAGTKGKRYSLPNSRIMIHQPLGGAQGTETDIGIQTNEMQHHKANLSGYLALHTGQSLEKIYQDTDRDFFMSPKEAVEYGLIDGIILNPFKALPSLAVPLADQSSS